MQRMVKWLLAGSMVAVLAGCQPTEFGVPKAQFQKMTPAQRSAQIKKYNAEQAEKAKEKPFWDGMPWAMR